MESKHRNGNGARLATCVFNPHCEAHYVNKEEIDLVSGDGLDQENQIICGIAGELLCHYLGNCSYNCAPGDGFHPGVRRHRDYDISKIRFGLGGQVAVS